MASTTPRVPIGDKHDARRDQLAESALLTLSRRGYARTSLRDIAQNSPFSHGVMHYYFRDKTELIGYCVRYYKAQCVTRYDSVIADSTTAPELVDGFVAKLKATLLEEGEMHRLWYDLRTQGMFDESLRADVICIDGTLREMIWRVLGRYAELSGVDVAVDEYTAYGLFDGLFEQALLAHFAGDSGAAERLDTQVRAVAPGLLRG